MLRLGWKLLTDHHVVSDLFVDVKRRKKVEKGEKASIDKRQQRKREEEGGEKIMAKARHDAAKERNTKLTPTSNNTLGNIISDRGIQCCQCSSQNVHILVVLPFDHFGLARRGVSLSL